jgi:voltage-gated potassium channel
MYLIEGPEHGFTSIPLSIYWAIVTMTTVGYGDLAPQTVLGRMLASVVMIVGYGIIAVPTGIVTAELTSLARGGVSTQACPVCGLGGHAPDARHCKYCGAPL